jgi:hypothetical protein
MDDRKNDSYQEGLRGRQSTGTTGEDAIEYSRGKADAGQGAGGGLVVATVVLSPLICTAYPIVGLVTLGTALLVSRGGLLVGIKSGSGVLILVTLVSVVTAFFAGLAAERRASKSKAYRTVRWILRLLLVPGVVVSMFMSKGIHEFSVEGIVVLIILLPVGYWALKRADRVIGAMGES